MNRKDLIAAFTLMFCCSTLVGCANRGGVMGVDCCADIPAGSVPEPAGTKVCNWQNSQIASAAADQTVLYRADFVGATEKLSPAAMQRIARFAQTGVASTQDWIVEPSGDDGLDASRVAAAMDAIASRGITPTNVLLATPAALGLSGPQAERVAGGFSNIRNSSSGRGAPISRPSGLGGFGGGRSGF